MVTRFVKAIPTTISEISSTNFPKIILFESGVEVVADLSEQNIAIDGADPSTVVWEPDEELLIVFGQDFDTCVFSSYNGTTKMVKRRIPAPALNGGDAQVTADGGTPELEWTNAFQIPTKIFRTSVYPTAAPVTDFTLIAEIPGTSISGGTVTYIDASIELADEEQGVSYFVVNTNGTSNIVEFIGEIV